MIANQVRLQAIIWSEANIITPQSFMVDKLAFFASRLLEYKL